MPYYYRPNLHSDIKLGALRMQSHVEAVYSLMLKAFWLYLSLCSTYKVENKIIFPQINFAMTLAICEPKTFTNVTKLIILLHLFGLLMESVITYSISNPNVIALNFIFVTLLFVKHFP